MHIHNVYLIMTDGRTKNGTFLDALEDCGDDWGQNHDSVGHFWEPVFFPSLSMIKSK